MKSLLLAMLFLPSICCFCQNDKLNVINFDAIGNLECVYYSFTDEMDFGIIISIHTENDSDLSILIETNDEKQQLIELLEKAIRTKPLYDSERIGKFSIWTIFSLENSVFFYETEQLNGSVKILNVKLLIEWLETKDILF